MTSTPVLPPASVAPRRSWSLPDGVAFALQASIVVFFLAGSSAPTPLYAVYQAEWRFSSITTTVVFGVYALSVLATLLVAGSLSDHLGRRPVLLVAVGMQAAAMIIFATAGGVPALLVARIIQGLATGAAVGAVGAGMLDLNRSRGTIANAVAPLTGAAIGAIGSGLLVQYLPSPGHLVYLVLLGVFALQAVGLLLIRETSAKRAGALASLYPQLGVPPAARSTLLLTAPVLVSLWSLVGFYGSVGPAVARTVVGSSSLLLGGLALFTLAGSGGVSTLLLRNAPPRTVMLLGTLSLIVGVGLTLLGIDQRSALAFFLGTALAGAGIGGGFQGSIRLIVPLAAPHERAGLLSTVYVVSYLAMGLPAVVGGVLVVHGGGLLPTAREYGVVVMALAAVALLGVLRPRHDQADREPMISRQPEPELAEAC